MIKNAEKLRLCGKSPKTGAILPKKILPICLLPENRHCVVVGGGKAAIRKVESLLKAGALVTVIAPAIHETIIQLKKEKKISILTREINNNDLNHAFIVIAATNNKELNSQIVKYCQGRNILVGAVDYGWQAGDFISPAVIAEDGLTVAISTGGKSCRRSRMIKQNLIRHISSINQANLLVLGSDHNYLDINKRELYHLTAAKMEQTGTLLQYISGVHEFILLNTCNRTELIAIATQNENIEYLLKHLMGYNSLADDSFYIKWGMDAFNHTANLAAGLLSQVLGENHIVAQIKDSLQKSNTAGWARGIMHEWIGNILHISKHIRTETNPLLKNIEIENICQNYLKNKFSDLRSKKILIIGSGILGQELTSLLVHESALITLCYHSVQPEITKSNKSDIVIVPFNKISDEITKADIIICATGSEKYILNNKHANAINNKPASIIIDLAMPRNVNPSLSKIINNTEIIDLDDLKHWHRRKRADIDQIHKLSNKIVNEHKDLYEKITDSFKNRHPEQ